MRNLLNNKYVLAALFGLAMGLIVAVVAPGLWCLAAFFGLHLAWPWAMITVPLASIWTYVVGTFFRVFTCWKLSDNNPEE